jgi:hypothetical protein
MHETCISKLPRFQPIDRTQIFLRTTDVESLIAEDHPVRAIWIFLDRLDLSKFSEEQRAVEGGERWAIGDFPALTIVNLDLFLCARCFERAADQPGDGA